MPHDLPSQTLDCSTAKFSRFVLICAAVTLITGIVIRSLVSEPAHPNAPGGTWPSIDYAKILFLLVVFITHLFGGLIGIVGSAISAVNKQLPLRERRKADVSFVVAIFGALITPGYLLLHSWGIL